MASLTKVLSDTVRARGRVKSGLLASIGINDIVIADGNQAGYVTIMGAGASEGDSAETFLGMAIGDSTETITVDGFVDFVAPHNSAWLELQMTSDDGATDLVRASVGLKVRSASGTKGSQTLDTNTTTLGVFKILDPHDNVFDGSLNRVRVALKCAPWATSSVAILK